MYLPDKVALRPLYVEIFQPKLLKGRQNYGKIKPVVIFFPDQIESVLSLIQTI